MQPYQLLIAAIAAALLLGIFFNVFEKLFQTPEDPVIQIQKSLQTAKLNQGTLTDAGTLQFQTNQTLFTTQFSEAGLELDFSCTDPALCCDRDAPCSDRTNWTSTRIGVRGSTRLPAYARCEENFNLIVCTAYFGKKPAQLSVQLTGPPDTVNLSTGPVRIQAQTTNTGTLPAIANTIELSVFHVIENQQTFSYQQTVPIETINPSETRDTIFTFDPLQNGRFEARVTVRGENAGTNEKTIRFETTGGVANTCRALTETQTEKSLDLSRGQCREKFFCSDCALGIQCKTAWETERPELDFMEGDSSFAAVYSGPINNECN